MSNKIQHSRLLPISVDEEMDRDNTSIENQKAIITDFVKRKFPDSTLEFYEDRDRSGYTFEQREGYQELQKENAAEWEYVSLSSKTSQDFHAATAKVL